MCDVLYICLVWLYMYMSMSSVLYGIMVCVIVYMCMLCVCVLRYICCMCLCV